MHKFVRTLQGPPFKPVGFLFGIIRNILSTKIFYDQTIHSESDLQLARRFNDYNISVELKKLSGFNGNSIKDFLATPSYFIFPIFYVTTSQNGSLSLQRPSALLNLYYWWKPILLKPYPLDPPQRPPFYSKYVVAPLEG